MAFFLPMLVKEWNEKGIMRRIDDYNLGEKDGEERQLRYQFNAFYYINNTQIKGNLRIECRK